MSTSPDYVFRRRVTSACPGVWLCFVFTLLYPAGAWGSDCRKGDVVTVELTDLQEMHNHLLSNIDKGMAEMKDHPGQGGLPAPPAEAISETREAPYAAATHENHLQEWEADRRPIESLMVASRPRISPGRSLRSNYIPDQSLSTDKPLPAAGQSESFITP